VRWGTREEAAADRAERKVVERKKLLRIEFEEKLMKGSSCCG
jgi:hypothetical protein